MAGETYKVHRLVIRILTFLLISTKLMNTISFAGILFIIQSLLLFWLDVWLDKATRWKGKSMCFIIWGTWISASNFIEVQFSIPSCDSAVHMFWIGWGTKTTWLGLGKGLCFGSKIPFLVTTNMAGNCPVSLKMHHTYKCWNPASNCDKWLGSFVAYIHQNPFTSWCETQVINKFC